MNEIAKTESLDYLDQQIVKAEKWNMHLEETIQQLQSQLEQEPQHKLTPQKVHDIKPQLQNISKLIQFAQKKLKKQQTLKPKSLLQEIQQLQKQKQTKLQQKKQLQQKIKKSEQELQNYADVPKQTVRNQLIDQEMEVKVLQQKLQAIKKDKRPNKKIVLPPTKSKTLFITSQDTHIQKKTARNKKQQQKTLLQNLIKFYQNQQSGLEAQIKELQQINEEKFKQQRSIDQQIQQIHVQIENLKKRKIIIEKPKNKTNKTMRKKDLDKLQEKEKQKSQLIVQEQQEQQPIKQEQIGFSNLRLTEIIDKVKLQNEANQIHGQITDNNRVKDGKKSTYIEQNINPDQRQLRTWKAQ